MKNGRYAYRMREWPMKGAPVTNWPGYSFRNSNGDGNLIYPSAEYPIPSIRLKNITDGMEDFYYLKLLHSALEKAENGKLKLSKEWIAKAKYALEAPNRIVKSLKEFNRDYLNINKERAGIAKLLEEANAVNK